MSDEPKCKLPGFIPLPADGELTHEQLDALFPRGEILLRYLYELKRNKQGGEAEKPTEKAE